MASNPTVDDLFGNVERWRADSARFRDPATFAEEMRKRVATRHYDTSYMFRNLGMLIEPIDRTLGIDENSPTAKAFHLGACLGFGVVEYTFGRRTDKALNLGLERMNITVDHEDPQHENHLLGAKVLDVGRRGFAEAGPYRNVLEGWEDAIWPEVSRQTFLKAGFGFVIRMGKLAIVGDVEVAEEQAAYQAHLDAMKLEAEHGVPDEEFTTFLESL